MDFHKKNLLLLKSYNNDLLDELNDTLNKNISNDEVFSDYKEKVLYTVSNGMNKDNKISIIKDLFERYKPMLNSEEIEMFNNLIDSYENQKIPFSTLGVVIRMYATRFKDRDVLSQTFFCPYPENLINITDSGKGRKL